MEEEPAHRSRGMVLKADAALRLGDKARAQRTLQDLHELQLPASEFVSFLSPSELLRLAQREMSLGYPEESIKRVYALSWLPQDQLQPIILEILTLYTNLLTKLFTSHRASYTIEQLNEHVLIYEYEDDEAIHKKDTTHIVVCRESDHDAVDEEPFILIGDDLELYEPSISSGDVVLLRSERVRIREIIFVHAWRMRTLASQETLASYELEILDRSAQFQLVQQSRQSIQAIRQEYGINFDYTSLEFLSVSRKTTSTNVLLQHINQTISQRHHLTLPQPYVPPGTVLDFSDMLESMSLDASIVLHSTSLLFCQIYDLWLTLQDLGHSIYVCRASLDELHRMVRFYPEGDNFELLLATIHYINQSSFIQIETQLEEGLAEHDAVTQISNMYNAYIIHESESLPVPGSDIDAPPTEERMSIFFLINLHEHQLTSPQSQLYEPRYRALCDRFSTSSVSCEFSRYVLYRHEGCFNQFEEWDYICENNARLLHFMFSRSERDHAKQIFIQTFKVLLFAETIDVAHRRYRRARTEAAMAMWTHTHHEEHAILEFRDLRVQLNDALWSQVHTELIEWWTEHRRNSFRYPMQAAYFFFRMVELFYIYRPHPQNQPYSTQNPMLDGIPEERITTLNVHAKRNDDCPCGAHHNGKPIKYKRCCAPHRGHRAARNHATLDTIIENIAQTLGLSGDT